MVALYVGFSLLIGMTAQEGPKPAGEIRPAVAILAPAELPPKDSEVQSLIAESKEAKWYFGKDYDVFLSTTHHVVLVSHKVPELRRLLLTITALETLEKIPGDDPTQLPESMRPLVTEFIQAAIPGYNGIGESKAALNCIVRPLSIVSVSSGGRSVKVDVELPTFSGLDKDERNKRMRALFDHPAQASFVDEASAQKAVHDADEKWKQDGGTKGLNLRLVNRQRSTGIQPKLYEEATAAFAERLVSLQDKAQTAIAKFLPEMMKNYPAYFGNQAGSVPLANTTLEQRLQIEGRLVEGFREFGFASADEARSFLRDATVDGSEPGLSVGVGIMPAHMVLRIPLWPQ